MIYMSLGYDSFRPTEPLGILILIIGAFFTYLTFLVFINVNQNKDSLEDKRRKEFQKSQQVKKIAKLYPKNK